jgi:hypothetical protein
MNTFRDDKNTIVISRTIAFTVISLAVFIFTGDPAYEGTPLTMAYLGLIIPLISFYMYLFTREAKHVFIIPTLFITWVYFLHPYTKPDKIYHYYRIIPEHHLGSMSIFCALSLLAIFMGYYFTLNNAKIKTFSTPDMIIPHKRIELILIIFILVRLVAVSLPVFFYKLGGLVQIVEFIPTIVFALIVYYKLREGRDIFIYIVTYLYLLIEYFYFVGQTLFTYVIFIFVGGLVVYLLVKKRIPFVITIMILIFTYPVYTTRIEHRRRVVMNRWYGGHEYETSFFQIAAEGLDLYRNVMGEWSYSDFFEKKFSERSADEPKEASRMEQISYLGQCVYVHKDLGEEYKHGSTFWWVILAPVPRLIIPWKPKNEMATKMAEDYGLKGKGAKGAMNFPMLVEYFINFNYLGMIILSFFQGMTLKWVVRKTHYGEGDINLLIVLNLVFYFLKVEANITLVFGAIIQIVLFWAVLLFILERISKI